MCLRVWQGLWVKLACIEVVGFRVRPGSSCRLKCSEHSLYCTARALAGMCDGLELPGSGVYGSLKEPT